MSKEEYNRIEEHYGRLLKELNNKSARGELTDELYQIEYKRLNDERNKATQPYWDAKNAKNQSNPQSSSGEGKGPLSIVISIFLFLGLMYMIVIGEQKNEQKKKDIWEQRQKEKRQKEKTNNSLLRKSYQEEIESLRSQINRLEKNNSNSFYSQNEISKLKRKKKEMERALIKLNR